jgi:O-antigen ligase
VAGARLPRIDARPVAWALAGVLLSLVAGAAATLSPAVAISVVGIVVAAALIAARPFPALMAVVVLLGAIPMKGLPLLVATAGTLAIIARTPSLPGKRFIIPALLFLLIAAPTIAPLPSPDEGLVQPYLRLPVIHAIYAKTPSEELREWINLLSVLVVFCLAAWTVRSRRRLELLVTAVLVSAIAPIANAFQQLITGKTLVRPGSSLHAVQGPFSHPNYFAAYLVVVLALAVVAFFETERLGVRVATGVLLVAGSTCLLLTYTRAAWVGFAVVLLGLGALRYRRLLVVAVVALVLAALAAPGAAHDVQKRFGDLTSKSAANDANSWRWRVDQWSRMVQYGFDRPITGQGFESYPRVTVREFGHFNERYPTVSEPSRGVFSPVGFTAHNDYVKSFVELGVPGVVLWVLMLVGLVGSAWRARFVPGARGTALAMATTGVGLMLFSASDNLQGYTVVLTYAAAVCGGLAGVTAAYARR